MNRSGSDVPHRLEVADDGDEAAAHLLQRDVLGQPAAGRPGVTPVRTPVRNAGQKLRLGDDGSETAVGNSGSEAPVGKFRLETPKPGSRRAGGGA